MDQLFSLLRYAIGSQPEAPVIAAEEWPSVFAAAQQQTVAGVVFGKLREASAEELQMPRSLLLEWFALSEQVRKQNMLLNQRCVEVAREFQSAGFRCCVLKGQGNALMYPDPFVRTPGDIDLWVLGKLEDVIGFVRQQSPSARVIYHHADYGLYRGVDVEVHYRPSFMNSLFYNRRLQKWFVEQREEQFRHLADLPGDVGQVNVPTVPFNVVFQLSHIYNHVIHDGIGLRQLVDYYYLMRQSPGAATACEATLRHLGLWTFAGAVMWVLHEVLWLEPQYLIAPMDEARGRFLLHEMTEGGNFGHYDSRVSHRGGQLRRNVNRLRRDLRLVRYFPSECLWEPVFRWYHFFWRLRHR